MTLPPRDVRLIGQIEGAHFPDISLPDQRGTTADLHQARAGRRAARRITFPLLSDGGIT
jgi:hypothetical protein